MDSARAKLCIGRPVQLFLKHACPNGTRLYPADGLGWHRFELAFDNGAIGANVEFDTWLTSFQAFRDELISLDRHVKGKATLSTTECDFRLEGEADKLGHITWNARVRHPGPIPEAILEFWLRDDQTSRGAIIAQVELLIAEGLEEPSPPSA